MRVNGQRTQDTQGAEGWKEGSQGLHLQQSPSATDGNACGKERRTLTVYIENASQSRTLHLQAETAAEVMVGLFREVPSLNDPKLSLQLFTCPKGSEDRRPLVNSLEGLSQVWATVYLFKH